MARCVACGRALYVTDHRCGRCGARQTLGGSKRATVSNAAPPTPPSPMPAPVAATIVATAMGAGGLLGALRDRYGLAGRTSRHGFVTWHLVPAIFLAIAGPGMLTLPGVPMTRGWMPLLVRLAVIALLVTGVTRRLHDLARSGWTAVPRLVSVLGIPVLAAELLLLPGDAGPNRFGPPPR